MKRPVVAFALGATALASAGCHDLSSFTTRGDSFQGRVVPGSLWSAGVPSSIELCLTLDAEHLQDAPGLVWTSDSRFEAATLRPIPQIWRDALSTLSFGEGRLQNLLYAVGATAPFSDGNRDVLAVVSLMQSGGVEVRLVRGAPALGGPQAAANSSPDAATPPSWGDVVFGVFALTRQKGPCSF